MRSLLLLTFVVFSFALNAQNLRLEKFFSVDYSDLFSLPADKLEGYYFDNSLPLDSIKIVVVFDNARQEKYNKHFIKQGLDLVINDSNTLAFNKALQVNYKPFTPSFYIFAYVHKRTYRKLRKALK